MAPLSLLSLYGESASRGNTCEEEETSQCGVCLCSFAARTCFVFPHFCVCSLLSWDTACARLFSLETVVCCHGDAPLVAEVTPGGVHDFWSESAAGETRAEERLNEIFSRVFAETWTWT